MPCSTSAGISMTRSSSSAWRATGAVSTVTWWPAKGSSGTPWAPAAWARWRASSQRKMIARSMPAGGQTPSARREKKSAETPLASASASTADSSSSAATDPVSSGSGGGGSAAMAPGWHAHGELAMLPAGPEAMPSRVLHHVVMPRARRLLPALSLVGLSLLAAGPASAALAQPVLSSNWAGYAADGKHFGRIAASWTVHRGTCSSGVAASEVTWVGIGGNRDDAKSLEQAGTALDCTPSGARYSAWYELVPRPLRTVSMRARPGDRITASVTVRGHDVRVAIRNRTTGRSTIRFRRMSSPDTSSAEWIVEAPSSCVVGGSCQTVPLADFGSVSFAHASAITRHGHRGAIADSAWTTTPIELIAGAPSGGGGVSDQSAGATPGALRRGGSAFTVRYHSGAAAASARRTHTFLATRR